MAVLSACSPMKGHAAADARMYRSPALSCSTMACGMPCISLSSSGLLALLTHKPSCSTLRSSTPSAAPPSPPPFAASTTKLRRRRGSSTRCSVGTAPGDAQLPQMRMCDRFSRRSIVSKTRPTGLAESTNALLINVSELAPPPPPPTASTGRTSWHTPSPSRTARTRCTHPTASERPRPEGSPSPCGVQWITMASSGAPDSRATACGCL